VIGVHRIALRCDDGGVSTDAPLVLGIETSCDETGVGIVRGNALLADAVASSVEEHARFGGVVPEVASRAHLEAMVPTIERACADAGVRLRDVDALSVTSGPGLTGALLIGVAAAKALAIGLGVPLYGVNHLAAHVAVDQLEHGPLPEPCLALLVSGGHSSLLLVEDVTEARRVEAVRRDFVANVSHELKTPVGAMSLLAEALQDASEDPTAVRRFAGRLQHEAGRLARLVQELIDLSRLQGADPLPDASLVPVDKVVAEAVDRTRTAAAARGISIVRGGERGLTVSGSESQLVTAVGNLIDNAVHYSPEKTRVGVAVRSREGAVEISVTDQGMGIADKDLERVFERFYRADPARSRATGGTGLGLAIVKHVATNHGGEVSVWSVEGSGSTFTLRLPPSAGADQRQGETA